MKELDELLEGWPDDDEEASDVHIEHHYHGPVIQKTKLSDEQSSSIPPEEEVTKPVNLPPRPKVSPLSLPPPAPKTSITPKVQRITAIIVAVAAGIAGAVKILWDTWQGMKK